MQGAAGPSYSAESPLPVIAPRGLARDGLVRCARPGRGAAAHAGGQLLLG